MTELPQPAEPVAERTCRVHVEGFDGPLELLLSLVKERQFDIMTVPLASVAEQYLAFVSGMEHLDIDSAAEYLVIAATLAFLKSRSLLPPLPAELQEEGEQSPEEVEERLRRRLIAYSKFREIATVLRDQADDVSGFYWRPGGDPMAELNQRYSIDTQRLARALERALAQAKPEKRTIVRERFSLVLQMQYVKRRLGDAPRISFLTLIEEYDRQGIIVTFLAVLELVRQNQLAISQEAFDEELFVMPYEEVVELSVN
jgi:segregation and condensation protein A